MHYEYGLWNYISRTFHPSVLSFFLPERKTYNNNAPFLTTRDEENNAIPSYQPLQRRQYTSSLPSETKTTMVLGRAVSVVQE
jgi:hypothetical protein